MGAILGILIGTFFVLLLEVAFTKIDSPDCDEEES